MTVAELISACELNVIHLADSSREISGGYTGDLLSWVMSRADEGDAWITIMTNGNVAAVAQLKEVACVVFAEGVQPDEDTLQKARLHDINLLSSPHDSFELCARIARELK
ncbi:MAG: DRTGG domain-containing protein [Clostridia bacterium]|nr:DRTGG domain-containing protein [Clostridia bacterium]